MTYFSLRKREPEPEPEPVEEEQPDEAEGQPDEEPEPAPAKPPTSWRGALWTGICGPGRWLAVRFGTATAWTVYGIAAWACRFYGGWLAVGVVVVWLLLVLAFTPKEYLDRLTAAIERRIHPDQDDAEADDETPDESAGEAPTEPDPADVLDLVRDLIGDSRGVLLTALRQPLRAADTRAVREVLAGAGIRVREGVRTAGGNGPGVHRDDLPPLPPIDGSAPVGSLTCTNAANTNANNRLTVQSREGMTIINDPADRHRTHTLKKR